MKIILSIPLAFLIIFSGINVGYSAHFCGGSQVLAKISLKGQPATCGMETGTDNKSSGLYYTTHCCDNFTTSYSICNNYIPSSLFLKESNQQVTLITFIPPDLRAEQKNNLNYLVTVKRPPGVNCPENFDCRFLCIFRF